ncbi:S-adenosyl-L-methionine-dependent methyltransferase [Choanephora cucurbitarum]|nr:S-adenosyl-L-methionine-dependent methyltransferase [Choanephora cucurbitarum]
MIHALVVFHVPEGLEFIAARDIESALPFESTITHEPKTGYVHVSCQVESYLWLKDFIRNARIYSIYSATLIASVSNLNVLSTELLEDITRQAPWHAILPDAPSHASFRATFKKGRLKHAIPSQTLAGHMGSIFSSFYPDWKVKVTDYDYEIIGLWLPDHQFLLGLTLPIRDQAQRHRIYTGRTSLNPCIAYCLVLLADPKPGQIVFDMCCGTATIPIEGASRFKDVFWLGGEVKMETLTELALGNVKYCGLKNVDLMLSDGRKLCYRDGLMDMIVSDWPWGLRENSYKQIQGLYPKFMKQMWRVLKPEGKAYIVTQGHKLMKRVLDYDWCQKLWKVEHILPFGIGGYDVNLYILSKI